MSVLESLLRGAGHTLGGEASAQHKSDQYRENEEDEDDATVEHEVKAK